MIAKKIHVNTVDPTLTFVAAEGKFLRVYIGKQGEMRLLQVEVHEDVDIETKKQLETISTVRVWNRTQWEDYENGDLSLEQ